MISTDHNLVTATGFDLLGQVGVELCDHDPRDAAMVRQQLGWRAARLEREGEISIRFADDLQPDSWRYVGGDEAGFAGDQFFLFRGRRREPVCVSLPIDRIGANCNLVCQRGLSAIPLLPEIAKVTALAHGILPLHASAFAFRGQGAVVTGFAQAGKTTTLLGFMDHDAQFIGDDTVYFDEQDCIHGELTAIQVSDRHLSELPRLRAALSYPQRLRILTAGVMTNSITTLLPRSERGQGSLQRGLRKLKQGLQSRCSASVPPAKLFARRALCDSHRFQRVFLSIAHAAPEIEVESVPVDEFARRLVHVVLDDLQALTRCYDKFRFAFPERANALLDDLPARIEQVARKRLAGKALYTVCHPYPVSPQAMFTALAPAF